MYLTRFLLSIVFVLFASAALAGKAEKEPKPEKKPKPEKVLVCHVSSTKDSEGSTSLKIDLISVSEKSKHIKDMGKDNPKHYFVDDTGFEWVDYYPEEGVGDDPADFDDNNGDGIDDGCELEVACPCQVDEGEVGDAWRGVFAGIQQSGADVNRCVTGSDYTVRYATAVGGSPGVSTGVEFDQLANADFGACAASFEDGNSINKGYAGDAAQKRTLHNACVRLIDEAIGEPTDGQDCTL